MHRSFTRVFFQKLKLKRFSIRHWVFKYSIHVHMALMLLLKLTTQKIHQKTGRWERKARQAEVDFPVMWQIMRSKPSRHILPLVRGTCILQVDTKWSSQYSYSVRRGGRSTASLPAYGLCLPRSVWLLESEVLLLLLVLYCCSRL
jgi:hypothetical protein